MEIKLEEQSPDGINISVSNLIVDTIEEANEFTKWIIYKKFTKHNSS